MNLMFLGRGLLLGGAAGAVLALLPAIVLGLLPAPYGEGFFGLVAALLSLSVAPLAVFIASAGALLLLVAAVKRARSSPDSARAPSPPDRPRQ